MKNSKSGNGVKVANLFEVVRIIEGKNNWNGWKIEKMKSAEMLAVWDYKKEGLALPEAKTRLLDVIALRKKLNIEKVKVGKSKYFTAGKYLLLLAEKNKNIERFLNSVSGMESVRNYLRYSYGNYKYQHRSFILPGTKMPYPVVAKISWSENHDWEYYAKSYGRPKSTYSDRAVIFQTIGKLGKVEEIFRFELASFAGNFMEKAIVAFFKVEKVKCAKELKHVQLADYFSLNETNRINGYRLFERKIGDVVWDYAILDTKTGTTYHANSQDQLVAGLRAKIQAKLDVEFETITKETGYGLGFCETGMRQFCEDNNVDFEGAYSRKELRNIAIQKREVNCKKYKSELKQIGIHLNCK